MAAARLSPAASLLRNSKLFALPAPIALPNPEPSSEPVPRSDTATSIYPTRAAIETPYTSLSRGDWGLKRPLPLKSTTKSGSPTVRLNKGIDTREHIADFDSAADHVLTLKKFQELNVPIQNPRAPNESEKVQYGVFRRNYDNTTNAGETAPSHRQYTGVWPSLSPSDLQKQMPEALQTVASEPSTDNVEGTQKLIKLPNTGRPRRWRYGGPSLTQMSGLEFDQWLKTLDTSKRAAFHEKVKQHMLLKKQRDHAAKARDEGTVGDVDPATLQVSEEDVSKYIKKLRQLPQTFGPLIADFLDLPDGPPGTGLIESRLSAGWRYGRDTIASETYQEVGPPRTHPSAGLSYIHTARWAQNHAVFGPQDKMSTAVARQVKTRAKSGSGNVAVLGLAGFIVEKGAYKGTLPNGPPAFEPQPGGQKQVVRPSYAEIGEKGALKFVVSLAGDYQIEDERPVHNSMVSNERVAALRPRMDGRSRVMQPLTRNGAVSYRKRDDVSRESTDEDFDFLAKVD